MYAENNSLNLKREEVFVLKELLIDKQVAILANVLKENISDKCELFCTITHLINKVERLEN
jgi:hypothetical protein